MRRPALLFALAWAALLAVGYAGLDMPLMIVVYWGGEVLERYGEVVEGWL